MAARKYFNGFPKRFLIALLIYLIPLVGNLRYAGELGNSILAYSLLTFGGPQINERTDIFTFIVGIVPPFVLLYVFSDLMRQDCEISCTYVFTRYGSRKKWFLQKMLQLFLQIFITFLLLFLSATLLGLVFGLKVSSFSGPAFQAYCGLLFCNVGALFVLAFLQNVLSLWYGSTPSFLAAAILYLLGVFLAFLLYSKNPGGNLALSFFPSTCQMYLWHDDVSVPQMVHMIQPTPFTGLHLAGSYGIIALESLLIGFVGCHFFEKSDLINMLKEV